MKYQIILPGEIDYNYIETIYYYGDGFEDGAAIGKYI